MKEPSDVDRLILETRRYEFSDGLRDFQLALLMGLGGLGTWLALEPAWMAFVARTAVRYGRWAAWVGMAPMVLLLLAVWGMLRVMAVVRRRWLWRESGMVSPVRWAVPRRVNVASAVILLGGVALGFGLTRLGYGDGTFLLRMLWTATGWAFGYTLFAMGRFLELPRYRGLGLTGGALSTLLLFLPLPFGQASLAFGLLWCALLAGSGLVALRRAALSLRAAGEG